jgi:N-acyl-phosphatidylethanolamine-hydrolysing phospholipase D
LGNEAYFASKGVAKSDTHCLDWWDSRIVTVPLPASDSDSVAGAETTVKGEFVLTCTPSQHLTGRGIRDRFKSLWASWAIEQVVQEHVPSLSTTQDKSVGVKVWFAGDTGYRAVKDGQDEDTVPCCPVFKEIGTKFGGFDLALIPIGYGHSHSRWVCVE